MDYKHGYLFHTSHDKAFKGTTVNRELQSLNKESLKNTLPVPLIFLNGKKLE